MPLQQKRCLLPCAAGPVVPIQMVLCEQNLVAPCRLSNFGISFCIETRFPQEQTRRKIMAASPTHSPLPSTLITPRWSSWTQKLPIQRWGSTSPAFSCPGWYYLETTRLSLIKCNSHMPELKPLLLCRSVSSYGLVAYQHRKF